MPKKKEIEEEEVEDEDLEEEVEIKDKKFNIKKKIPKVDLNLQNLEFHQFMQPVQTESPVLEKIADGQEKQIGRGVIFKFSKAEKKEVIDKTVKEVMRDIKRIISESFK